MPTKRNTTSPTVSVLLYGTADDTTLPMLDTYTTKAGDPMFGILSEGGKLLFRGTVTKKTDPVPTTGDPVGVILVAADGTPTRTPVTLTPVMGDNGRYRVHGNLTIDGNPWHIDVSWNPITRQVRGGVWSGEEKAQGDTPEPTTPAVSRGASILANLNGGK